MKYAPEINITNSESTAVIGRMDFSSEIEADDGGMGGSSVGNCMGGTV